MPSGDSQNLQPGQIVTARKLRDENSMLKRRDFGAMVNVKGWVRTRRGSKPVSYTHLDVYKRQIFCFLCLTCLMCFIAPHCLKYFLCLL